MPYAGSEDCARLIVTIARYRWKDLEGVSGESQEIWGADGGVPAALLDSAAQRPEEWQGRILGAALLLALQTLPVLPELVSLSPHHRK